MVRCVSSRSTVRKPAPHIPSGTMNPVTDISNYANTAEFISFEHNFTWRSSTSLMRMVQIYVLEMLKYMG